MILAFQ